MQEHGLGSRLQEQARPALVRERQDEIEVRPASTSASSSQLGDALDALDPSLDDLGLVPCGGSGYPASLAMKRTGGSSC